MLGDYWLSLAAPSVKMLRSENPYLPSDRFKPNEHEQTESPPVLDVDLALFTVPDRNTFAAGLDYCPSTEVMSQEVPYMFAEPTPGDMTGWGIRPGREMKINNCVTTHPSADACLSLEQIKTQFPLQYRPQCTTDMPETHTFAFTTEMYVLPLRLPV